MVQSGMRITVDAAMRARDVSKSSDDAPRNPAPTASALPGAGPEPAKPRKGERRRLGKRAAARRTLDQHLNDHGLGDQGDQGRGGSSPLDS